VHRSFSKPSTTASTGLPCLSAARTHLQCFSSNGRHLHVAPAPVSMLKHPRARLQCISSRLDDAWADHIRSMQPALQTPPQAARTPVLAISFGIWIINTLSVDMWINTHKGKHANTLAPTPHRFVCTLSNFSRTPRRPSEILFRPNRQSVGFDKYRGCHSRCVCLKQLVAAVHSSVIYLPSYASPLGAARSTRRIQPSSDIVVFPTRIWLPCSSLTTSASASQLSTVLGPVFVAP
jgi:hypothetical protein